MRSANITYYVIVRSRKCQRIDWADDRTSYYMEVEHPSDPAQRLNRSVSEQHHQLRAEIDATIERGEHEAKTWGALS
ncbi:hypothetical protein DIE08_30525 [Burkholderia sp. Bp9004]|nr:hypothetical protein DIE08_30525 [Burkholderia sp. Bp9004]